MIDIWELVAGIFMILSVGLSFYAIIRHLCTLTKPYLQRYIIRILLMVPIYSTNAWFALIFPSAGIYLDSLREVYESFVIYSFMKYLLNYLHYDTNLQQYIDHKPGPRHIFPLCFLPTCVGGKPFMMKCKHGILQYVVIRPLTTLIAFTSQFFNIYGEGHYNPLSGYTYPVLLLINNASQITAMYCLVIFYSGYRQELNPMKPLAKFFSIKLVVFFSFFQSVVIQALLEIDFIEDTLKDYFPGLKKNALARKVQELLICFDMLIAAVGHLFAFPYKPFEDDEFEDETDYLVGPGRSDRIPNSSDSFSCCQAIGQILDFSDEKSDVSEHFGQIFSRIRRFFTFREPLPVIVTSQRGEPASDSYVDEVTSEKDKANRVLST